MSGGFRGPGAVVAQDEVIKGDAKLPGDLEEDANACGFPAAFDVVQVPAADADALREVLSADVTLDSQEPDSFAVRVSSGSHTGNTRHQAARSQLPDGISRHSAEIECA